MAPSAAAHRAAQMTRSTARWGAVAARPRSPSLLYFSRCSRRDHWGNGANPK